MQCAPLENLFHQWQGMWGDIIVWPVLLLRYRLNPRRIQVLDQKLGCNWPTWYERQWGAGGERKLCILTSFEFLFQTHMSLLLLKSAQAVPGRGCCSHVRQHWRWAEMGGPDRSWGQPLVCATNTSRQNAAATLLSLPSLVPSSFFRTQWSSGEVSQVLSWRQIQKSCGKIFKKRFEEI